MESCDVRPLFRHHNDKRGVQHRQQNSKTNLTTNLNVKIMCASMAPENQREDPPVCC